MADENTTPQANPMMAPKNLIMIAAVGLVILAGAYYFLFANKSNEGTPSPTPTQSATEESTEIAPMSVVLSEQNSSGQGGTATLTETNGQTTVSITLDSASDVAQPAHIHAGACPTPGDIAYPLTDVVDGTSETVLDVDLATLQASLPLAINVHKSNAEISVYTSCGDLL